MEIRQNNPPWICTEITEILNDRDNAFTDAYNSKLPDDLVKAKDLRTKAKKAVRNARAAYIQDNLERNGNDTRKFWLELNKLIKGNKPSSGIELIDENKEVISRENTADHINQFFSTIGS